MIEFVKKFINLGIYHLQEEYRVIYISYEFILFLKYLLIHLI